MLSDLEPIVVDVHSKSGKLRIYPIADLHYGSQQFLSKEWEKFIRDIQNDEDAYVMIAGDMMNNAIRNSVGCGVYYETVSPSEQKRWLSKQLEPIKDKIICGCNGNHERRSSETDTDPLYDVFVILGIEERYRENACFVFLRCVDGKGNKHNCNSYSFCVTHGIGNGMYIGSSSNRAERFGTSIDGLDCLIYGHTHKPITFPVSKLKMDASNKKITTCDFTVVAATSWLGYGGYAVRAMYSPAPHKQNLLILSPTGVKKIQVLQ